MVLDENKQELGQFSQQFPLKFGFLKQKAKELGMSTQEFIEHFADRIMKQEPQQNQSVPNKEITEIREILKEQSKVILSLTQNTVNKPLNSPQTTPDPFSQLKGLIGAFKELRSYDNEVIAGYRNMKNELLQDFTPEENAIEEYAPEDKMLYSLFHKALNNQKQEETKYQTEEKQDTIIVPNSESENVNTEEIVQATPQEYKQSIKEGKISLEEAKAKVRELGIPLTNQQIEEAFNMIKEETT